MMFLFPMCIQLTGEFNSALFASLCTYEVAFVMIIFIVLGVLAYTSDIKYSIKVLIPDFIAYGAACVINIILRMSVHNVGYSGISINFDIKETTY